jgi:hypothetical protein
LGKARGILEAEAQGILEAEEIRSKMWPTPSLDKSLKLVAGLQVKMEYLESVNHVSVTKHSNFFDLADFRLEVYNVLVLDAFRWVQICGVSSTLLYLQGNSGLVCLFGL